MSFLRNLFGKRPPPSPEERIMALLKRIESALNDPSDCLRQISTAETLVTLASDFTADTTAELHRIIERLKAAEKSAGDFFAMLDDPSMAMSQRNIALNPKLAAKGRELREHAKNQGRIRIILEKLASAVVREPASQVAAPPFIEGERKNTVVSHKTSAPIHQPVRNPTPGIEERVQSLIRILTAPRVGRSFNDPVDQAMESLARIGKPAVEALIAALGEPLDQYTLSYVIEPLGKIGDPQAVDALLKLVNDPSKTVRSAVVKALGGINDPRGIDPLIQALHDSDKYVRAYAAEGLGKSVALARPIHSLRL